MSTNRHIILYDVALELIARVGSATVCEMLAGIALQQEIEHAPAIVDRGSGVRLHYHAFGGRCRTRRKQLVLALDRDETDPAVADDWQLGIPTQRRNLDPGRSGRFENGLTGLERQGFAVDSQGRHEVRSRRSWSSEFRREDNVV